MPGRICFFAQVSDDALAREIKRSRDAVASKEQAAADASLGYSLKRCHLLHLLHALACTEQLVVVWHSYLQATRVEIGDI